VSLYKLKRAARVRIQTLCALALLLTAAASLADESDAGAPPPPPPVPTECQKLDARIAKRKTFLAIRGEERIHHPTNPTFSPFCEEHPSDEDCQLPGQSQDQRDLSRDISEDQRASNGDSPIYDPILVPLERKRRELHCPAPSPPRPVAP
jgi:hypothetical protein